MRRKVRVNMVESLIQEYALEEDEIQAKKWKNKKYLWITYTANDV